ncbi:hypothetical protein BV20DRAFT_1094302 [Pilatotrama ljubarskyi]|nr:hypothetical protein BV20DRAFT_1094302 [Pilatotrama ljubarskyi]
MLTLEVELPTLDTPVPALEAHRILRPFLSFKDLSDVRLSARKDTLRITDDDIGEITRTWPKLRKMHISSSTPGPHDEGSPTSDRPTVRALVELARHCPSLESLTLPCLDISGSRLPSSDSVPVLRMPLSYLMFDSLVGEDESDGKLAILLDRLFPNLHSCGIRGFLPANVERGGRIKTILKAMQLGREHERLRKEQSCPPQRSAQATL